MLFFHVHVGDLATFKTDEVYTALSDIVVKAPKWASTIPSFVGAKSGQSEKG